MNKLAFINFCKKNLPEWQDDILKLNIEFKDLDTFTEILGMKYLSDGGLDGYITYYYFIINLVDICENFDINPEDILKKK